MASAASGYAQAYLTDGSPLAADAITVSPYLGLGSLAPALELAESNGRGVFVLALTSNPEGSDVQHAVMRTTAGEWSVARGIVEGVGALNESAQRAGVLGSVGLVVGATVGGAVAELGIDLRSAGGPLLAPGVGAQGAGAKELAEVFGDARRHVLASTSRGVLQAGPHAPALRAAARVAAQQALLALRG